MGSIQPPRQGKLRIAIDRGGTFTDCYAEGGSLEKPLVVKLLSVDPSNYADAPTEGIRRILETSTGSPVPRGQPIDASMIEVIRCGTTVATNALLERQGERHALATTKGFKDLLRIGTQNRPNLFDLHVKKADVLFSDVVEIDERVTIEGYTYDPEPQPIHPDRDQDLVLGASGDVVRILKRPDHEAVERDLERLRQSGYNNLAICLAHAFAYPEHERQVAAIAKKCGFEHVSISSEILPMIKMVSRGHSASADAYLTPHVQRYIDGFLSSFQNRLKNTRIEFMQSDGGLVNYKHFTGLKAILSGPAGGVVGYAETSWSKEDGQPVIGFDMGGTSTDVSRYDGVYHHTLESITAGVTIQCPQLDITTVAAGGGSILHWENGIMSTGPDSAGAHPGPACYRKGGPLTITDANLFLGRIHPETFPKIFGPNENEALDVDICRYKFTELAQRISSEFGLTKTPEEVAYGFINVANESMARAIREVTEARGYDTGSHQLASFGGAGGQHAAEIARMLRIKRVIIHRHSSILSAFGMSLAKLAAEVQSPYSDFYENSTIDRLNDMAARLQTEACEKLLSQGIRQERISVECYLNMRYEGTDTAIMILKPDDGDFRTAFLEAHMREFTFLLHERKIVVDDIRVRAIGDHEHQENASDRTPFTEMKNLTCNAVAVEAGPEAYRSPVYMRELGWYNTPVYLLGSLKENSVVEGPVMILDATQTIVVPPGCRASILSQHVVLDIDTSVSMRQQAQTIDPILLSVFSQRFMSIAEMMGRTLQKTSVSANISERLDFSCAIFGPDGGLVANAPHVPVHLGSMQYCIEYQHKLHHKTIRPGDVLLTNHPSAGGTHLPDLTVVTPCFDPTGTEIVFYCASRGHHTDIGGNGVTSMSPNAKYLWEEGAAVKSFKMVHNGRFDEEGVEKLLVQEPAAHPGCSGSRRLSDNVSDLKAQVSANAKGITLIRALFDEYGRSTVVRYMSAIRDNAELATREFLAQTMEKFGQKPLEAEDFLDDGSRIKLRIDIDPITKSAVFDFTGTGSETLNNLNAPPAITHSAIMYCLRCMVGIPSMPLNQGVLKPIKVIIPPYSVLNPSEEVAVCAGNPVTSQRIVDVILRAFDACAASQGDSNCIGIGFGGYNAATGLIEKGFAYGETICGGSGAGASWNGASGVHVHMTNTRITDVETLEKRYPVILRRFEIRTGSGGKGQFCGGNGVIREIQARKSLRASVISERRVHQPYGLHGGEPAKCGRNTWIRRLPDGTERRVNMTSRAVVQLDEGDSMEIRTPGGGGWGYPGR